MIVTEYDRPITTVDIETGLLDAYTAAQHMLGGSPAYQRLRVRAAGRFLAEHPDLDVWMRQPSPERLAEISADAHTWPRS